MLLSDLFSGVFNSGSTSSITLTNFLLCVGTALVIGLFLAFTYTYKTRYTKSFVVTLATLPAMVCMVIMMVNGNLGVGVAVAGTFGLIKFRSLPGTAKEIGAIFLAMGTGLATGIGYLGYAVLFAIIVNGANMIYTASSMGDGKGTQRTMKITIPEDLDYIDVLEDLFSKYTSKYDLISVKTTNMGSLFRLTYDLILKDIREEKAFIDDLRCRNGNLEIMMSRQSNNIGEL